MPTACSAEMSIHRGKEVYQNSLWTRLSAHIEDIGLSHVKLIGRQASGVYPSYIAIQLSSIKTEGMSIMMPTSWITDRFTILLCRIAADLRLTYFYWPMMIWSHNTDGI